MKKRLIIRESDFKKIPKSTINRYESVMFTPFTKDYFKKRVVWYSLKGKQYLVKQYMYYEYPGSLLRRMTEFKLYDRNYQYWLCKYDEDGEMKIRAGLGQPESRLGFVTFREKQYDTVD